jgi:outer membrane protein assembly factor BamB
MTHTDQLAQQDSPALRQPTPATIAYPATLLVGSLDGTVALLRAQTGDTVWRASPRREVGTLAHDGAHFYVAFGSPLHLVRPPMHESQEQCERRCARLQAEPARLEARSARDGHLLWQREEWGLIGRLDVDTEAGGAVIVVGSTSIYGDHALYGLDARTGATRWTYPATGQMQINGHRFALRGGRLYCYGEGRPGGLVVLDAGTGQPLWRRDGPLDLVLSPGGQVIVELRERQGEQPGVCLLDAATGAVRQIFALDGYARAVTDAGVACLSTRGYEHPGLAVVRLDDGRERWRVDDILTYQLAASDTTIYCAHLCEPEGVGEVEALEAGSGRRRWRWRTPGDLHALLRLWGTRLPWIGASCGVLVGKTRAAALAQPSPREVGLALWWELKYGQWRRPYALDGSVNAMWLAAGAGTAYLGTRLGVFALREDDGRLLWHALPTTDVSFRSPALAPAHPAD